MKVNRRDVFKRVVAGVVAIPVLEKGKDLFASVGQNNACSVAGPISGCQPQAPPPDLRTPEQVYEDETENEAQSLFTQSPDSYFRYTRYTGKDTYDRLKEKIGPDVVIRKVGSNDAIIHNGRAIVSISYQNMFVGAKQVG